MTLVSSGRVLDYPNSPTTPSWNVSQVCQLWCQTALGYPQLWAYIGINLHAGSDTPGGGFWNLLGIQLSRAHRGPLFISIENEKSLSPTFLPFLMISASRWKHIKVVPPSRDVVEELRLIQPFLHDVEALDIAINLPPPSLAVVPISVFKNASPLRELGGDATSLLSLTGPSPTASAFSTNKLVLKGTDSLEHGEKYWLPISNWKS